MKVTAIRVVNVGPMGPPEPRGSGQTLVTPLSTIERAEGLHLAQRGPVHHQFVEVDTDDGLTGYGIVGAFDGAAEYMLRHHLSQLVVGEDPRDTTRVWEKMYRGTLGYGRRGIVLSAISAVDIALWDIKGKAFGQPLYNLLGGRMRESIPLYASRMYASTDLDAVAAEAKGYLHAGYRAMKMRFGYGPADGEEGMTANVRQLGVVRSVVGPEVRLMADVYMGWDVPYFVRIRDRLADLGLYWLEEPVSPDDVQGYAEVRRLAHDAGMLIAGGEHEYTAWGVHQLCAAGGVDVLQVDVNRVGGVTEALRVWAIAAVHGVQVVPHGGQMHNYHLVISHPNSPMAEHFPDPAGAPDRNEIFWKVWDGEPVADRGEVRLSDRPGLGLQPRPHVVEEFGVGPQA